MAQAALISEAFMLPLRTPELSSGLRANPEDKGKQ